MIHQVFGGGQLDASVAIAKVRTALGRWRRQEQTQTRFADKRGHVGSICSVLKRTFIINFYVVLELLKRVEIFLQRKVTSSPEDTLDNDPPPA